MDDLEQRLKLISDSLKEIKDDLREDSIKNKIITHEMLKLELYDTVIFFKEQMDQCRYNKALEKLWEYVHRVNQFWSFSEPWKLIKTNREEAEGVIFVTCECLEAISVLIQPVMPQTSDEMRRQIGLESIKYEVGRDHVQEMIDKICGNAPDTLVR
jgi:methionyl-tRNA synthetase